MVLHRLRVLNGRSLAPDYGVTVCLSLWVIQKRTQWQAYECRSKALRYQASVQEDEGSESPRDFRVKGGCCAQ